MRTGLRTPVTWGLVVGVTQAASPLAFWWLDAPIVYAFGLVIIASVYVGFAVADGRPRVLIAECAVATAFVVIAAVGVTVSPWLLVAGLAGHGFKDLWQHRHQVRRQYSLVAAVLPCCRLDSGDDHRCRPPRRGSVSQLCGTTWAMKSHCAPSQPRVGGCSTAYATRPPWFGCANR